MSAENSVLALPGAASPFFLHAIVASLPTFWDIMVAGNDPLERKDNHPSRFGDESIAGGTLEDAVVSVHLWEVERGTHFFGNFCVSTAVIYFNSLLRRGSEKRYGCVKSTEAWIDFTRKRPYIQRHVAVSISLHHIVRHSEIPIDVRPTLLFFHYIFEIR